MASNIVHYNHWASKQSTLSIFEHWNDYKQASNPDSLIAKHWKSWRCAPETQVEQVLNEQLQIEAQIEQVWNEQLQIEAQIEQVLNAQLWSLTQMVFWLPAKTSSTSSSISWLQAPCKSADFKSLGFKLLGSSIRSPLEAPLPSAAAALDLKYSTLDAQASQQQTKN